MRLGEVGETDFPNVIIKFFLLFSFLPLATLMMKPVSVKNTGREKKEIKDLKLLAFFKIEKSEVLLQRDR